MMSDRYSRHILLKEVGRQGQKRIGEARVLVVGVGGLGCPALQYLAAAGIGTLGIVDFDVVELSNLHRQPLFGTSSLGNNKALSAKAFLQHLNPTITVKAYPEKLTVDNVISFFEGYDIIVDGTDNFETRYLINDASLLMKKPLVYGAIYKFEGQVSVFHYLNGPSYRCLFPSPPHRESVLNCNEIGVLGVLPGIIGTMQAAEVLKIVLGIGTPLSGILYCYDALLNKASTIRIARNEAVVREVLLRGDNFMPSCQRCEDRKSFPIVGLGELTQGDDVQFVDVRELDERPKVTCRHVLHLPLSLLNDYLDEVSNAKRKVIFCKSGARSRKALNIMEQNGIQNCWLLKENANEFIQHYEKTS